MLSRSTTWMGCQDASIRVCVCVPNWPSLCLSVFDGRLGSLSHRRAPPKPDGPPGLDASPLQDPDPARTGDERLIQGGVFLFFAFSTGRDPRRGLSVATVSTSGEGGGALAMRQWEGTDEDDDVRVVPVRILPCFSALQPGTNIQWFPRQISIPTEPISIHLPAFHIPKRLNGRRGKTARRDGSLAIRASAWLARLGHHIAPLQINNQKTRTTVSRESADVELLFSGPLGSPQEKESVHLRYWRLTRLTDHRQTDLPCLGTARAD